MQTITLGSQPLDAGDFRLLAIDFNAPPTEIHEVTSALADKNIQADLRTSAYRDIVISLAVSGSDKQTHVSNLKLLSDQIAKDSNTLTVQPDGQTGKAVAFVIGRNPEPEIPFDQAFESGLVAHVTFVLKAEPYAYRDAYPTDAAVASTPAPFLASLTNLGERPAPIGLTVDAGGSTAIDALYLALADPQSTIDWYYKDCVVAAPFTWESTYFVSTSDTGAWGGTAIKYDPVGTEYRCCLWTMATGFPPGRYRFLMRARVDSGGIATIRVVDGSLSFATMPSASPAASKTISNTGYALLDFGEVDVPQRLPRSGLGSALGIAISLSDASKNAYLDAVMLVPTTSLVRHGAPSGSSIARYFETREDGSVFIDSTSTFDGVSGGALRLGVGAQKLLVITNPATQSGTKPSLALTMKHLPRYVLWRSA